MRRGAIVLLLLLVDCAGCSPPPEVRWPASPPVSLRDELITTSRIERAPAPVLPSGEVDTSTELPEDAPGIRARAFVFEGLWVAEVELGEVPDGTPLPLVVMLHGRGDGPRIPGGPFGRVPTPMRVLVPRGPLRLGEGYAWARFSVTQGRDAELADDLLRVAGRLARLIDHVQRTRPSVGTPIVTGFSQGAILAWTLAVQHPAQVGLVIPIAGWVPPAARPADFGNAVTRAMHGTVDPIVKIEPTRAWVSVLREAGQAVEFLEYADVGHTVTPEMNETFERWLEEALQARAPELGGGLGQPGVDPEPMEPYEPPAEVDTDEEAIEAPLGLDGSVLGSGDAGAADAAMVPADVSGPGVDAPEAGVGASPPGY